ncbi:MAG: phosphomannomutase/phosphoglucomutase [Alphaproteobacteria bacterium]|nr:phosphomannomutase/phosphoglucomutase [Alphaproteobacteria bacterium]
MSGGPYRFDPTILREYDIRGIVGKTLSVDDARAIGSAFGAMVWNDGGRRVAVGYDGRHSSPSLEAALVAGLVAAGLDVSRIGLGPTPMLYFSVFNEGLDGGVMVTGSHNPPDYNGFKMMLGLKPFYGEAIQELGRISAGGPGGRTGGRSRALAIDAAYIDRVVRDHGGGRPLKVAWDAGNGAGGTVLRRITDRLPGTHVLLNDTVDGDFPAHHPDPTVAENLVQLQAAVRREGCDLGIAFDGDGDRIGVVDGEGHILWADQLLVLLARDVLGGRPGATIISDVKASQVLFDAIAEAGGQPLMWRTGHSLIKAKMAETKSPLAGEMSGHIFFADRYYGYDDAFYVAVRTLDILSRSSGSLADFRRRLPPVVNTPELRFPCPETRKFAVLAEVKARLKAAGATVDDTDGVRVKTADGWWLLRASNTQDVLVARCEAGDEAGLGRLRASLLAELHASDVEAPKF